VTLFIVGKLSKVSFVNTVEKYLLSTYMTISIIDACDVTLSVYIHTGMAWKICLATVGIEPTTFGKPSRCGYTLRVTSQASYSPEYITPTQKISHRQL
jgi:hypothetical protein